MFKRKRIKKQRYDRNIEDAPFYLFQYKFDDLPLDPAKEFITEQISKYIIYIIMFYTGTINLLKY